MQASHKLKRLNYFRRNKHGALFTRTVVMSRAPASLKEIIVVNLRSKGQGMEKSCWQLSLVNSSDEYTINRLHHATREARVQAETTDIA